MVVRLEGNVNGESVILTRSADSLDLWKSVIPATLNGRYVIGLTAYDDAGNVSSYSTYILTVDLKALRVSLKPFDLYATLHNEK